jgi:uncharacterized protein DUF4962/heparinase II/III-like protein
MTGELKSRSRTSFRERSKSTKVHSCRDKRLGNRRDWLAPKANARIGIWALILVLGCSFARANGPNAGSTPVVERPAQPGELLAYPADGQNVGVNPPGFCWTPFEGAKAYRLEVTKLGEATQKVISTGPLASTVFPPAHTLAPGSYSWRVFYLGGNGVAFGTSSTRTFIVRPGLAELPMPDVARLKTELVRVRPRLLLARDRLHNLHEVIAEGKLSTWKPFLEAVAQAEVEMPYPEPRRSGHGPLTSEEDLRIFRSGKVGSAHLVRLALAYRITGEKKHLDGARRWLMALASWDPRGITSHRLPQPDGSEGDDEASMPMLERMSLAWDWMGDKLSRAEGTTVLAVMRERGNQVLETLQKEDFLSHPYQNHDGRVLAFLGEAGLAFLGDIPEADSWLDYVLRCYLTSYPSWGSDDGGWAQGVSYWSIYLYWLSVFAESLREVSNVNLLRRPFFRHTGYFGLYMHPPYAPRAAFGDDSYSPPTKPEQMLVDFLADSLRDPILKWQAESIRVPPEMAADPDDWYIWDVVSICRAADTLRSIHPESPTKLDGSRLFSDIGWAVMHSALGDAYNDVWAMFKASRFGSFSHSHGDQNTFLLNAFGQALAIETGYYPEYGPPHDELWTRQTKAHNGILVNGRGQPPYTWAAAGQIESFERHGFTTVVRGQAADAYNLPQPEEVARRWHELLKEPLPPMEPKVESFERTLVFDGSRKRPVVVVSDYLRTSAATNFDWLLHGLSSMETDGRTGSISLRNGNARLAVRLISTEPFSFSQSSGFLIPPEPITDTAYPNPPTEIQWHLKAHTERLGREIKFLAVLVPFRASEPPPEITALRSSNARGFRIGDCEVAVWWGQGNRGVISLDGLKGNGRLVVRVLQGGKAQPIVSE